MVQRPRKPKNNTRSRENPPPAGHRAELLARCMRAFVRAGTLDLSLDQLSHEVGISKRMLIHYFGHREAIEEQAMTILEDQLRARFRLDAFPPATPAVKVLEALWQQSTSPESRGVLLLIMELTRRAWRGSKRAQNFYREQQKLWVDLLLKFSPDRAFVEMALQLFQGAILTFVVTGDRALGPRVLRQLASANARSH